MDSLPYGDPTDVLDIASRLARSADILALGRDTEGSLGICKVSVPEGTSGKWAVQRFTVGPIESFKSALRDPERAVAPGEYTRLVYGSDTIMSDTVAEMLDHADIVAQARGHILIMGLGLGMVLQACLSKPEVTRITVVEMSYDVLQLVAKCYQNDARVTIEHADAFEYVQRRELPAFDVVWADIWPSISDENLAEMDMLESAFTGRAGWVGSWCRKECEEFAQLYEKAMAARDAEVTKVGVYNSIG